MNKNKKIFITIIIIFSIIYLLIIKKNNKKYEVVLNKIKTYDYNEWIKLNTNCYLKRDASFYFLHQELIRLFFLAKTNLIGLANLNGSLLIKTNKEEEKVIHFDKYSIQNHHEQAGFVINSIDIKFKTDKLLTSLRIRLNGLNEILNVKIKDVYKANKKYACICSLPKELRNQDYKLMHFWFEFNQMIGFDKIFIYNNSIENNVNFNDLFEKYSKLIELKHIKYYPMFQTNLTSQLQTGHKWLFEAFIVSECYLDNIDLYENIFVIDQDELLIPRKFKSVYPIDYNKKFNKTLNIDYPVQKTDINNFIDLLRDTFVVNSKTKSLHFKMAFYFQHSLVKQMFAQFNNLLLTNTKLDYLHQITIENNDLSFTINTKQQYEYLKYLVDQYKKIYEPFFEKNLDFIEKHMPESYSRFYFLSGSFVYRYFGKTFHNVQSNPSYLSCHHPKDGLFLEMKTNYAHVSHFRNSYENYFVNSFFQDRNISIDQLFFDYNYFYSYFQIIKDSWLNF